MNGHGQLDGRVGSPPSKERVKFGVVVVFLSRYVASTAIPYPVGFIHLDLDG